MYTYVYICVCVFVCVCMHTYTHTNGHNFFFNHHFATPLVTLRWDSPMNVKTSGQTFDEDKLLTESQKILPEMTD